MHQKTIERGGLEALPRNQIVRLIDHTRLNADADEGALRTLCEEAREHHFATVAVNPVWVSFCAKCLAGARTGITACIGFPLGANTAPMKVEEAREAVRAGATEVDMVVNIGALKSGYAKFVEREIAAVVRAVEDAPVKVILETSLLTEAEKVAVCEMSVRAGAAFVKTSTGYGKSGATAEDVALMRRVVGHRLGVKAAGGIRSYRDVLKMVNAGASRIGTSAGVTIADEAPDAV